MTDALLDSNKAQNFQSRLSMYISSLQTHSRVKMERLTHSQRERDKQIHAAKPIKNTLMHVRQRLYPKRYFLKITMYIKFTPAYT